MGDYKIGPVEWARFVFSLGGPKQNAWSLLIPVSDTVFFIFFHMVASFLLSMVPLVIAYFKDLDWMLKNVLIKLP